MRKLTHKEYEEKLFELESDLFPLEEYVNYTTKLKHVCLNDHISFKAPNTTLKGHGCSRCSGYVKKTHDEYLEDLSNKFSDYLPLEEYINTDTRIKHQCKFCKKVVDRRPNEVLTTPLCRCNNMLKPTILYYVKLTDKNSNTYYKIGVTLRSIKMRFSREKDTHVELIYQSVYPNRALAMLREAEILQKYNEHKVDNRVLVNGGNSEIFKKDIVKFSDIEFVS